MYIDASGLMTSPVGSFTTCEGYAQGHCMLKNNETAVWIPSISNLESFVFYAEKDFYSDGPIWISSDNKEGLSGSTRVGVAHTAKCSRCKSSQLFDVYRSDQGVFFSKLGPETEIVLKGTEQILPQGSSLLEDFNKMTGKSQKESLRSFLRSKREDLPVDEDIATTGLTTSFLQAAMHNFRKEILLSMRKNIIYNCQQGELTSRILLATAHNPYSATMFARELYNSNNLYAEISGNFISVYKCHPVKQYTILPMNNTCFREIPLRIPFTSEKIAYLDPITRVITSFPHQIDCSKATELLLDIDGGPYLVNGKTGHVTTFRYKTEPLFPMMKNFYEMPPEVILQEMDGLSFKKLMEGLKPAEVIDSREKMDAFMNQLNDFVVQSSKSNAGGDYFPSLFKYGLLTMIFGEFSWWTFWVTMICLFISMQVLLKHVIPLTIKVYFIYATGGSFFNLGDGIVAALKRRAESQKKDVAERAEREFQLQDARLPMLVSRVRGSQEIERI
jgi:hypothetical protein